MTVLDLDPAEIIACFGPYAPDGYTAERARHGLDEHIADEGFRRDLEPLLRTTPINYDIDAAARLVRDRLFSRL